MKRAFIMICVMVLLMAGCEGNLSSQVIGHDNGTTVWKLMYDPNTHPTVKNSSEVNSAPRPKQSAKPQDFHTEDIHENEEWQPYELLLLHIFKII